MCAGVAGLFCSRSWDGWLCWDDTPAGSYASQNCPDYFTDFDPSGEQRHSASRDEFTSNRLLAVSENLVVLSEKATKYCGEDGRWFHHPEADRIWTNYTLCASGHEKRLRVTICPSLLNLQGQDINQIILYQ